MDSDDSLIIMAVSNVVAALALLAMIGLTALPIDLAPTWADRAIEGPLKYFGATDPDYRIRHLVQESHHDRCSQRHAPQVACLHGGVQHGGKPGWP